LIIWRNVDPSGLARLLERVVRALGGRKGTDGSPHDARSVTFARDGRGRLSVRLGAVLRSVSNTKFMQQEKGSTFHMNLTKETRTSTLEILNRIMEMELAGVVRYTHYSFMVYGFNRLPIVSWLRSQANESLLHAQKAGEMITLLGGHPSLAIGPLLESEKHDLADILKESLEHEAAALSLYEKLLDHVTGHSVMIEEYARQMIAEEELHAGEVNKMLRLPGTIAAYAA
jgi:bacterioferritin